MYLSCLLINVGDDPDRPRPGRLWLHNLYRVHQRLCMAFPSASRTSADPDFLQPFNPDDFGPKPVHAPRGRDAGFLFRIDPQLGGRVVILVQSAAKPDWNFAFHNARHLLAAPPSTKAFEPSATKEQRYQFRLVANPTRKIDTKTGADGQKNNGQRVPVSTEKLEEWLRQRAGPAGFRVERLISLQTGYVYVSKNGDGEGNRLRFARYDGILQITDPARFHDALIRGIGPGKAYGCGLLSIAPFSQEAIS